MRVALNGYFWNQPRTGSGQYLRHLWDALIELPASAQPPPAGSFSLLLPPAFPLDDTPPQRAQFRLRRAAPLHAGALEITGRSRNLDKILWEQCSMAVQARQAGATLLHSPYLAAPVARTLPTVVTAHDMIPWVVPGYKGSAPVQLYLWLSALGVKRAGLIFADSQASRRDVIKVLRVPPRKVRTVYLGVEPPSQYTPGQLAEVRARFGLPDSYAFYLGGFDRRKNVPLLLHAWHSAVASIGGLQSDNPVLAIGGQVPAPGGVFPPVMEAASALGFGGEGSSVRFLGAVSESDKPLLMAAARLFVYPSAYEGFGLDPLEAMSLSCPVISSSGGSLKEVVGGGGMLVPPGDRAALSHAIVEAWQNEGLRRELGTKGKKQAAQFTWQRTARETLRLYNELLNGNL